MAPFSFCCVLLLLLLLQSSSKDKQHEDEIIEIKQKLGQDQRFPAVFVYLVCFFSILVRQIVIHVVLTVMISIFHTLVLKFPT